MGHPAAGAGAAVLALSWLGCAAPAHAAPWNECRAIGTNDTIRPIPATMAPAVVAAFHVHMTTAEVMHNGVFRCAGGQVLACLAGANLNCGKANTRLLNPGGDFWCRQHPNSDFVPAFATGHETIYAWRCNGPHAEIARQVEHVDARGFIIENWKRLAD